MRGMRSALGMMPPGERPAEAGNPLLGGPDASEGRDYSLLPRDRTFAQSLPAFLFPYIAYVGLGSLPSGPAGPEAAGLLRFIVVAGLLWFFRRSYRFGPPLRLRSIPIAAVAVAAAGLLWIAAYRLSLALPWWRAHLAPAESFPMAQSYWVFRTLGSVLLVPLFEELLCRGYLMELLAEAGRAGYGRIGKGPEGRRIGGRMEEYPAPLDAPPLSPWAVVGSTLLFTLGHDPSAWLPAAAYFGFTTWIYAKTRSFRICVLVHAFTNLAIAAAVWRFQAMRFLWF